MADGGGYRSGALRAVFGLTGVRLSSRLFGMLRLVVVADLLGPSEIGVFAVSLTALSTLDVFSEIGVRKALVQKQGDIRPYLDVAWSVQLLRGVAVSGLLFSTAPLVAAWFRAPAAVEVLQLMAIAPLLRGAMSPRVVQLDRELMVGRLAVLELGATAIDVVLSIGLLLVFEPTVLALVWSRVAMTVYMLIVSFLLMPHAPKLSFRRDRVSELMGFGVWVFVSAVVAFILTRGGDFVVGRVLTTRELGIYTLATQLAIMPLLEVAQVVGRVTFPVYSKLQGDLGRLARAFCQSFLLVAATVIGGASLIAGAAPELVAVWLDAEWGPAATLAPWLVVWGACRALGAMNSNLFMAVGQPRLASRYQLLMLAVFAVVIYPGAAIWGLNGVGAALAVVGLTGQAFRYRETAKVLRIRLRALLALSVVPATAGGLAVLAAVVARSLWGLDEFLGLAVHLTLVATVFLAVLLLLDRWTGIGMLDIVKRLIPGGTA